jgi:hypothetical protein
MIVSITVVVTELDCVDAGAGAPTVSMSPANTEPERTHVKASAIKNRFMVCAPVFES